MSTPINNNDTQTEPAPRALRDLTWTINSPALLNSINDQFPSDNWFKQLPPSALLSNEGIPVPRHQHHFRLGKHFEELWATWLRSNGQYSLRLANLQVNDSKRTVGEFDFLIEHQEQVEHWEVAIKFYLGTGNCKSAKNWYGPNTEDRLDLKYNHLVNHQLLLGDHPAASEILATKDLKINRVRCIVKGRLFHPLAQFDLKQLTFPTEANTEHNVGWWARREEFEDRFAGDAREGSIKFAYLSKINWLSCIETNDDIPTQNYSSIVDILDSQRVEQATHLAVLNDSGNEISRGFVVNESWLERIQDKN